MNADTFDILSDFDDKNVFAQKIFFLYFGLIRDSMKIS